MKDIVADALLMFSAAWADCAQLFAVMDTNLGPD
jgi:hypothetical protein